MAVSFPGPWRLFFALLLPLCGCSAPTRAPQEPYVALPDPLITPPFTTEPYSDAEIVQAAGRIPAEVRYSSEPAALEAIGLGRGRGLPIGYGSDPVHLTWFNIYNVSKSYDVVITHHAMQCLCTLRPTNEVIALCFQRKQAEAPAGEAKAEGDAAKYSKLVDHHKKATVGKSVNDENFLWHAGVPGGEGRGAGESSE